MGRTLPTSTQLVQEFEAACRPYKRALRRDDQQVLDDLLAMVRFQSAAIAYASCPDPFQMFTLAMLGGILKRLIHLELVLEGRSNSCAAWPAGEEDPAGHMEMLPARPRQ